MDYQEYTWKVYAEKVGKMSYDDIISCLQWINDRENYCRACNKKNTEYASDCMAESVLLNELSKREKIA